MKTKILLFLITFSVICSCEMHDPIDDWARIGQFTPHVYWEIPSTTARAGENISFIGQFYSSEKLDIPKLQVWYDVNERIQLEVSCPILSEFKFVVDSDESLLVRESLEIASYLFSESVWDAEKKAYLIEGEFPTSSTLKTVEWREPEEFDEEKFATLFPDTLPAFFQNELYQALQPSDRFPDLRKLFVDLELLTTDEFDAATDSVYNDNSDKYDKFIKDSQKENFKNLYYAVPFEELIYDKSNMVYKLEYVKSYYLNSTFKAIDAKGNVGTSETKTIELQ